MFRHRVNEHTELRLIEPQNAGELFQLLQANRDYLRAWHPWVDGMRALADVERGIRAWRQQYANIHAVYAGIWFQGRFCGMLNHLNIDWQNRWAILSYWIDAQHQGKGIMTACCRSVLEHDFKVWKLNRITIECATENTRSRAIPERLGFRLEGIIREGEWLHGRFVDHAVYGLLCSDFLSQASAVAAFSTPTLETVGEAG